MAFVALGLCGRRRLSQIFADCHILLEATWDRDLKLLGKVMLTARTARTSNLFLVALSFIVYLRKYGTNTVIGLILID